MHRSFSFLFITVLTILSYFHNTTAFQYRNKIRQTNFKNIFINMDASSVEQSKFLNNINTKYIKSQFGTPVYVYDKTTLIEQASKALDFPNLYGLKVRFAMKACPNAAILQLFNTMGLCFDASSGYEVLRLIKCGVKASSISLSSQELPSNLKELIDMGIDFNACSLHQLKSFGELFPGGKCGIRYQDI